MKTLNDYARVYALYEETPKAVLAGILVSYANCFGTPGRGDDDASLDCDEVTRRIHDEWATLHRQGIIPQPPPKFERVTQAVHRAQLRAAFPGEVR